MRWTIKPKPTQKQVHQFAQELNVDELIATLLLQRGITTFDQAKDFFRPSLDHLHDPFLMKDMEVAVNRIEQAIANQENATIIIVTNEIGMGVHAETHIGRKFTELQGWMNQYIAATADTVVLMVSGIPVTIKEKK